MPKTLFEEQILLLEKMTAGGWTTLWYAVDTTDMLRALRGLDDDLKFEALSHIPPDLPEPEIPQRISIEEVEQAMANVCLVARALIDGDEAPEDKL